MKGVDKCVGLPNGFTTDALRTDCASAQGFLKGFLRVLCVLGGEQILTP
jgi:hypothetical protein